RRLGLRLLLGHHLTPRPFSHPPAVVFGERIRHVPRGRPCHRLATMPGHDPQSQVDPGRDARRSDHLAVLVDIIIPAGKMLIRARGASEWMAGPCEEALAGSLAPRARR